MSANDENVPPQQCDAGSSKLEINTIIFDPDGDLMVLVGSLDTEHDLGQEAEQEWAPRVPLGPRQIHSAVHCLQRRFQVCRSNLAQASKVWRHMLRGPFAETNSTEIPFPDDDPVAMTLILGIVHLRFDIISQDTTFDNLLDLTILIDKYELQAVVAPFWQNWVRSCYDTLLHQGKEEWLFIAWVFGMTEDFKTLAFQIARRTRLSKPKDQYTIDFKTLEDSVMPYGALDRLKKWREAMLAAILKYCNERILNPCGPPPPPPAETPGVLHEDPISACGESTCEAMMLGSLLQGLKKKKLWPLPDPKIMQHSVDELLRIIKTIRIKAKDHHRDCPGAFWKPPHLLPFNADFGNMAWQPLTPRYSSSQEEVLKEHAMKLGFYQHPESFDKTTAPNLAQNEADLL
ncbi:hypothetical protein EJ05DRAFT_484227 [Pseudovirgaria hyperparasitica]|uniref:BTB domain-containing protein n=1 Tax=Pseudovirgaria hyperparasitica TaxID=470096 RepID=A0A6A6WCE3_9PEZI|nr:uncharacterized protein EJ05DRAFT_484227 [Pseudovirgaria hyperparasitica]KAF2760502.1 hypothetical protein EJ05DRAFT_484227 [Pseudovirgaria hyperparasitica]